MNCYLKFAEMLENFMFEHGNMNAKTLADELGIAVPTVTRYLREERVPTISNLVLIADYFHCTTDYLLGRDHENHTHSFKTCPPFSEQLTFLIQYFNCTAFDFYTRAELPESSFFEWKKGSSIPTLYNILKIADRFECSVDFVLGREN